MKNLIDRQAALEAMRAYRASGSKLARNVVLGRRLGSGSFASVFAAGKKRVVKIIDSSAGGEGEKERETRTRMAEAEIAAMDALKDCPNVMPLHDHYMYENNGHPLYLLFMPRLETLAEHLDRTGEPLDCFALLEDLSSALVACSHVFGGIVHCDICLANTFVDRDGRYVLGDFGVAAKPGAKNIYGHKFYTAPDLYVSAASDIYSLGALLCVAASGKSPQRLPDGEAEVPYTVPAPLRHIVRKCLALRAEDRYRSAAELLTAVRAARRSARQDEGTIRVDTALLLANQLRSNSSFPAPCPDRQSPLPPEQQGQLPKQARQKHRRNTWRATVLLGALLVAAGLFFSIQTASEPAPVLSAATPAPTAQPRSTPKQTASPASTPRPTAAPAAKPLAAASPAASSVPSASRPNPTPAPKPASMPKPTPASTPKPNPVPAATPTPASTPEASSASTPTPAPHVHSFVYSVVTPPGCEYSGLEVGMCACGETDQRSVPATGHHYEYQARGKEVAFYHCIYCDAMMIVPLEEP